MQGHDRAAVNLVDVLLGIAVMIAVLVIAPHIYTFTGMAASEADPLSTLLLRLIVPVLFLALIVSIGVSGRGGP